jgi:hypothetical protein
MILVLVDLYRVNSLADVTIRFERAYARQLKGAVRARVEELLQRTGLGLSLGAFGIGAKLQLDPRAEGRRKGPRPRRAHPQPHPASPRGRVVRLLGLRARAHEAALRDEGAAARRVGRADGLGRLRDSDIAGYVAERFAQTSRGAGEALGPLLSTAQGHPQRVIMLARHL